MYLNDFPECKTPTRWNALNTQPLRCNHLLAVLHFGYSNAAGGQSHALLCSLHTKLVETMLDATRAILYPFRSWYLYHGGTDQAGWIHSSVFRNDAALHWRSIHGASSSQPNQRNATQSSNKRWIWWNSSHRPIDQPYASSPDPLIGLGKAGKNKGNQPISSYAKPAKPDASGVCTLPFKHTVHHRCHAVAALRCMKNTVDALPIQWRRKIIIVMDVKCKWVSIESWYWNVATDVAVFGFFALGLKGFNGISSNAENGRQNWKHCVQK